MKVSTRPGLFAVLFASATLVVLIVAYMPIIRAHQGWEDEIYWVSTCLSITTSSSAIKRRMPGILRQDELRPRGEE